MTCAPGTIVGSEIGQHGGVRPRRAIAGSAHPLAPTVVPPGGLRSSGDRSEPWPWVRIVSLQIGASAGQRGPAMDPDEVRGEA
jgi:hypothetical protein